MGSLCGRGVRRGVFAAGLAVGLAGWAVPARAIDLFFDYSTDTNNFFADPARRALLDQAAARFEGFTDQLAAITPNPGAGDTYTATFNNPSTGATDSRPNLAVPQNQVYIFVGARDLPGTVAGQGGFGGFNGLTGSAAFVDAVQNRGQGTTTGSTAADFGRYGGSIAFDTAGTTFHFGPTAAGLDPGETDFVTVATHELAHLLGFGTAPSWNNRVQSATATFTGPASITQYQRTNPGATAVPLAGTADLGHWQNGLQSFVGPTQQEVVMDPTLLNGTRLEFTDLDYAGLADVGWQIPEPTGLSLVGLAGLLLGSRRRRPAA
jgi:hypothetical protein